MITSLPHIARLKARYEWNNSASSLVRQVRSQIDKAIQTFDITESRIGNTVLAYAGLDLGRAYCLDFIEAAIASAEGGKSVAIERRTVGTLPARPSLLARVPEQTDVLRSGVARAVPSADLILLGLTSAMAGNLDSAPRTFVSPMRVHFLLDVTVSPESALAHASKNLLRDVRYGMRDAEWKLGVDNSTEWFDEFFDEMYLPTMRARHHERARVEGRLSAYQNIFKSGIPFYLSRNDEKVAGHFCHLSRRTGTLTSRLLGVRDGSQNHYNDDIVKIMYVEMTKWACANNVVRLFDLQGSEGFLSKPTYQMKRRLGGKVSLPPNHFSDKRLAVTVVRDTPAIRKFLSANPSLQMHGPVLRPTFYADAENKTPQRFSRPGRGTSPATTVDMDRFFES